MTMRSPPPRIFRANFRQRLRQPLVVAAFRTSKPAVGAYTSNAKLQLERNCVHVNAPRGFESKFTLKIAPSSRFATTDIRPLNPYTDRPPKDMNVAPLISIFVLRHSSMSNGPALLVPRCTSKEAIRSASNTTSPPQAELLDRKLDTSDATIWDALKRETYQEKGLYLHRYVGQFDYMCYVEMEGEKRVEQTTMNFAVAVKGGEMDANLRPGAAAQWIWVTKEQLGALDMKQSLKQVLKDAFACVEKSKDYMDSKGAIQSARA